MTRIIAGSARGRRLSTPSGDATRPTSDRVREAVFSTLESTLGSWSGRWLLDLFAGSGAVGLEAVSRGAAGATLVEQHRRTAAVARRNAELLGFRTVDVVPSRVETYLQASSAPHRRYDVAFLDPPYTLAGAAVTAVVATLLEQRWLAVEAVVVVERSVRGADLVWPAGVGSSRAKKYGETAVWYGRAT